MATVHVADQCLIPGDVATLAAFRRWAVSDEFPQTGRIDWVASHIEVDMSPSRTKSVLIPFTNPSSSRMFLSGTNSTRPVCSITCSFWPGRRPSRSRTARGMTTWNLGRDRGLRLAFQSAVAVNLNY